MDTARSLLSSLCSQGVRVWIDAGKLRVGMRKGALRPADVEQLHRLKDEILHLLEDARTTLEAPIRARPASELIIPDQPRPRFKAPVSQLPQDARTCAVVARILGPLDVTVLARAITSVMDRHESLRTQFILIDGVLRQRIAAASTYELTPVALSHGEDVDASIQRLTEEFEGETFDLDKEPIFAAKLYRRTDREHLLLFGVGHLVCDGMSLQILHREIWTLYQQIAQGRSPSLPPPSLQYADYCRWLASTREAWSLIHEAYWREHLRGAPQSVIPYDFKQGASSSVAGTYEFTFDRALSRSVSEMARRERVLPAMVGLAIYAATMASFCKQSELTVMFAFHGRDRPELEAVTGHLVQHLFLRIAVSREEPLQALVQRVSREYLMAVEHRDFGRVPALLPDCKTELYFNWAPVDWAQWSIDSSGGESALSVHAHTFRKAAAMSLLCFFSDSSAGVTCRIEYRRDLLSILSIERFASELLEQAQRTQIQRGAA